MKAEWRASTLIRGLLARRAGQRGLGAVGAIAMVAAMLGLNSSAQAQTPPIWKVQVRSGEVGGSPGTPGAMDTSVRFRAQTTPFVPLVSAPFQPFHFTQARTGPFARVADWTLPWLNPINPGVFPDPKARWISHTYPSIGASASVLYAIPFNVDVPCIGRAEITFHWAVDDRLGDPPGLWNPAGVYLNGHSPLYGHPITAISGGTFGTVSTVTTNLPVSKGGSPGLVPGTNWLYIYAGNTLAVNSGLIFSAEVCVWDCLPCAEPPANMVGWWPFDESGGTTTSNILLKPSGNGTLSDIASLGSTGKVGNAACLDEGHIDVSHYPALSLNDDLTIDSWINLTRSGDNREYTIVDKREFDPASPGVWHGYRLFVDVAAPAPPLSPPERGTLKLEFQDDAGSGIRTATGPTVTMEFWEHIAVIVDRHATAPGSIDVSFAVGGFCTPASITPGGPVSGTLGTPVTRIGNTLDPGGFEEYYVGCIDELEIFDRALDCSEIANIATAQNGGKCRESCNVEWDRSFYGTQQSILVPARLCNNTATAQSYTLAINPLACPTGSIPSPVGVAISPPQPVTVPAGTCSTVWLTIPRPPFTAIGDVSCYELCMTNTATGLTRCCQGSVQWSRFVVVGPPTTGGGTLASGSTLQMGFPVQNPGGATTIAYRVSAIGPDMEPDTSAMSLDDGAPGTPIEGVLDLPAGAETSIELTARFVEDDPWKWYAILLEMDLDGDGSFEAMESVSLMNALEDPCPPTIVEDFEFYIPGTEPCGIAGLGGMGGWNPWPGSTDVCGMVTTDEAFSGMRSLRIDGAMGGSTGLGDDMVRQFDLTSGRHVLTMQTLVPAGASGRGWVVMLSEFPAPFNWALNLMLDADAGVIRDEQDAGLSTPLVFGEWAELQVVIDLDADTADATYNGVPFIAGKSWTLGVPPSGPATFKALDLYADEPGTGTSGMYFDDIVLRTLCEPAADPCIADCDGSGTLDLFDFLCFQNAFAAGDLSADLDGDGALTLFDFLAFQNAFAAGCS